MRASARRAPGALLPSPESVAASVPEAVRALLTRLDAAGHEAVLVGGCVRDLARGAPVDDWDVATAATAERVLDLFPHAVPIGLRHGTVMIPTRDGPVDVTHYRAGPALRDDLARRDFTVNAIAFDPRAPRWIDPFGGAGDLAAGRLRAVGSAVDRLGEDPVRALRAARLVAQLGFTPAPDLEPAMSAVRDALRRVPVERVRRELERLVLAPGVAAGIALLRRSGLEQDWVPGARADAAAVMAQLPSERRARWTGWLRGTNAQAVLGRLRAGVALAADVTRLLALHPVERIERQPRSADAAVRRVLARVGPEGLDLLLALRGAELADEAADADARHALERLRARAERVRRSGALALRRDALALDGGDVMRALGTGPGPHVGAALRHLTECVLDDPGCNTREQLGQMLEAWAARRDGGRT